MTIEKFDRSKPFNASHDFLEIADLLCQFLADRAEHTSIEFFEDWAKLTAVSDGVAFDIAFMEPELPALANEALPMRFGLDLAYGLPSGKVIYEKPDTFFYLPSNFTVSQLFALAQGQFSPGEFTALLNFSVRHAMSVPRDRFPSSILLLIRDRSSRLHAGDRRFELWTQKKSGVEVIELCPTNNPHEAARESLTKGYRPTIYRCQSGRFIAFKATEGGVFL